jgi:two-component system CheB/CheR fusion protein
VTVKEIPDPKFEALLDHLKRNRGFDFTGYKRSSLVRRVRSRMHSLGQSDYTDYIDYLDIHPEEFGLLFNTILINVTSFFRDPEAWQYVAERVIPAILSSTNTDRHIRIWSAGCASGQEAYTVAMLFGEALGTTELSRRVKIYATDIDEEALAQGRSAAYSAAEMKGVPPDLVDKYFSLAGENYIFRPEMRRSIIFGRHDLVQDAPIPQLDLLLCRNTLMYMNAETQSRILGRFHFALRPTGYLFLGKAEMLLSHGSLFNQAGLDYRVFSKVVKSTPGERVNLITPFPNGSFSRNTDKVTRLRQEAFHRGRPAQLVVDRNGHTTLINEIARETFGLTKQDIGRPLQDLEVSYRPIELRSLIDQSLREQRPVRSAKVVRGTANNLQQLEVLIKPITNNGDKPLGISIVYQDVTAFQKAHNQLQSAQEELETVNEELQATNEELETTNEELQSTNEELETSNEELQSTNEELQTTNEELQSTNEELESINAELDLLIEAANENNAFLGAVMSSIEYGVIVLDKQQNITLWSTISEELWGLRSEEVIGKKFQALDIGLPIKDLQERIDGLHSAKESHLEFTAEAYNRRGKTINCRVRVCLLSGDLAESGFVVLVEEL